MTLAVADDAETPEPQRIGDHRDARPPSTISTASKRMDDALTTEIEGRFAREIQGARRIEGGDEALVWRADTDRGPVIVHVGPTWRSSEELGVGAPCRSARRDAGAAGDRARQAGVGRAARSPAVRGLCSPRRSTTSATWCSTGSSARRAAAGCSWAQIGRAFGISKQAAQQRFPCAEPSGGLWPEGFTGSAQKVLLAAEQQARLLGHNYIGTKHIPLGLIDRRDEIAAHALPDLGVTSAAVGSHMTKLVGHGDTRPWRALGVAPRAKKTLELARRQASRLGHQQVGTEHLLLALTHLNDLNDGVAVHILKDLGR